MGYGSQNVTDILFLDYPALASKFWHAWKTEHEHHWHVLNARNGIYCCSSLHALHIYDTINVLCSRVPGHAHRLIKQAMDHWVKHVPCLRFVQRTNQRSYISFFAGGGWVKSLSPFKSLLIVGPATSQLTLVCCCRCFSNVGRQGGFQRISIARGCEHLHIVVHEIGKLFWSTVYGF